MTTAASAFASAAVALICLSPPLAAATSYCDVAVVKVNRNAADGSRAKPTAYRGMFGDQSPRSPTFGRLVHVMSGSQGQHTGCTADFSNVPSTPTPHRSSALRTESDGRWIALVQRGGCKFVDKIYNAVAVHGAAGVIVYNVQNQNMSGIRHPEQVAVTVMLSDVDGRSLINALNDSSEVTVEIRRADPDDGSHLDPVTIFVATMMTLVAAPLNAVALAAICRRREKLKPHLYLVVNLIFTDLLISVLGAAQIAVLYESLHDVCMDSAKRLQARSSASILSRFWNVLLYSNMFTLFLLTSEHFVACRWPFWHKIIVTRRKVAVGIVACWIASCVPDAVIFAMECDAAAAAEVDICRYLDSVSIGSEEWSVSVVLVCIMTTVLATLMAVYGYILYLINRAGIGNIEAKKKRNAIVTTFLLLLSFIVSYVFFYVIHFSVAAERTAESDLLKQNRALLQRLFPTSGLLVDYMLTGVLGAIFDPLIYCARTKEVKLFLMKLFKKKVQRRATSSYMGVHSTTATAEYTMATTVTDDEQL